MHPLLHKIFRLLLLKIAFQCRKLQAVIYSFNFKCQFWLN